MLTVARCRLLLSVVCCMVLLFVVCWLLFVSCRSLTVACWRFWCFLFVARCALFVVCCIVLVFVLCSPLLLLCVLFVVGGWCWFVGAACCLLWLAVVDECCLVFDVVC